MKIVFRSTLALTTAHAAGYAVTLLEIPVLARALGAEGYGMLLWVQATALLGSMLVDWGFNLSASREIARTKGDGKAISSLCGNVFLAKTILLVCVSLPMLMAYLIFKPVPPELAAAGFVYLVAFGMSPFWYFQGMEKMGRAVLVEILTRLAALLGLIIFVKSPDDVTLALALMATGGLMSTLVTALMCRVEVGHFYFSLSGAINQIRCSTSIFIYKSSGTLVASAATTVLGSVAGKAAVGIFGPAEKLAKAVIGLALPLLNAFYPHLSRLYVEDKAKKNRQSVMLLMTVTIAGIMAAVILTFAGPTLMRWLLGSGFEEAGKLIVLMVWLIPLRLMNQTIGFAVLLPAQLEHRASSSMLVSAIVSLTLGALFATTYGAQGMVAGILVGEMFLLLVQVRLAKVVLTARG